MKTDFRPAYVKDFEACWNIIDQARRSMIASGRHQWTSDYPAEHDIKEDINNGNAYVLTVDGEIAVYGAVILNGEPQYDFIDGYARYMREALPNASFIGFTGTPIEKDDVNTPAVFGEYIDVYDISRAVEDGATVPIYYESRLARIELDETEKPRIDAEIADLTEDEAESEQERLKRKWASVEAVVGAEVERGG